MKKLIAICAVSAMLLAISGAAQAAITIDTVTVGNPGNAADTTGFGAVSYTYNIGKYDVTAAQYCQFLNAVAQTDTYGLYNGYMSATTTGGSGITQSGSSGSYTYSVATGRVNKPVTDVTFWDACRFANWLSNSQPTGAEGAGTTETGAYTLTATGIANNTITRNAGTTWAVTSENEWYKAAFYSPTLNGGAGGYWEYPTQSNTISTAQANYYGSVGDTTDVGSYPYPSYYGTYDQAGNVWQWNESIYSGSSRGERSGAFPFYFGFGGVGYLQAAFWGSHGPYSDPTLEDSAVGFRVSEVPEPATICLLGLGILGLLRKRRA